MQWVVIELTDADIFWIVATGGWDPATDVNHDRQITSLDALLSCRRRLAA
ncbi:MAG: hypothetical protein U9N46_07105 [Euryarchaeota archaeon]|nr:hypothetical protein [Euryarchaeota archaeon]